ncbi:MAG: hypothetical protein M1834_000664 [Cirrosporium novae-zelandiae]|nr:MAG: hypothetical protein M1834_000664 [Cirrosporium novae-zelandiae]
MNEQPPSTSWQQPVSNDSMFAITEPDFTRFLENLDDYSLDFSDLGGQNGQNEQNDLHHCGASTTDVTMENDNDTDGLKQMSDYSQGFVDMRHSTMHATGSALSSMESLAEMNLHSQAQTYAFSQQQQQQQRQQQMQGHGPYQSHHVVPPTPNSIEMQGAGAGYSQQVPDPQARGYYDHRYCISKEDQMVFTPLVSPAVTPIETRFNMVDFGLNGDYFSPITSPAIVPQSQAVPNSIYTTARSGDPIVVTSPVTRDPGNPAISTPTTPAPARRARRKPSNASTRNSARKVQQSPAMKAQSRRKQPSSTVIPPQEVAGVIEQAQSGKGSQTPLAQAYVTAPADFLMSSSEQSSVSPEALPETLMPPPAMPRSNSIGISPRLAAQQSQNPAIETPVPATPASLMKLKKRPAENGDGPQTTSKVSVPNDDPLEQPLDDIMLPEAATSNTATPSSVAPSPQIRGLVSPNIRPSNSSKQPDSKPLGRGPKKRGSVNSIHVSPALRPKISPNIQPLMPEGSSTLSTETSALLLASNSNYERLIAGQHLPGVSYPESLATNLTSKRTSHKIAEQGRRNRINNALKEMESLLTSPTTERGKDGSNSSSSSGSGDSMGVGITASQQNNSKASTVEKAIDYIRKLQQELKEKDEELQKMKGKLEVIGTKLEGSDSSSNEENKRKVVNSGGDVDGVQSDEK